MTMTAPTRRVVGQLIVVSALALILGGLVASPTAAQTRKQATHQANQESIDCFAEGGNPDANTYPSGTIETTCTFSDNSVQICTWEPQTGYRKDCHVDPLIRPPDTHLPVGGGGVLTPSRTAADGALGDDGHTDHPPARHRHLQKHRH